MRAIIALAGAVLFPCSSTVAGIATFYDDKLGWEALAGSYAKIDFVGTGIGFEQVPYDNYIDLGITIGSVEKPQGCDWALMQQSWASDGWVAMTASGFTGDPFLINFLEPQHAFAHDEYGFYGEGVGVYFYLDGELVGSSFLSPPFNQNGNHFFGWVTDFAFDRVVFDDSDPIDNMYVVPAPAALAPLLAASVLLLGARRRPAS
ncbi:MAG: hypothetical protein U0572_18230 [Phycisphaerales bacterium]